MKKIISLITVIFLLAGIFPKPVHAEELTLTAKSAVLIDSISGEVICEKDPHAKMYPASMTKIMTMLLCMEKLHSGELSLSDKITISPDATKMGGTQLFLETGEVRTVEDLLYVVAVESANDAATALGIHIGGSIGGFADMMNKKAKELGMNDSNFVNACGLHEDEHYTSAYDMAILSKELLKYEDIYTYISTWMKDVYIGKNNDILRRLANTNKLLSRYEHIDGIKTGYTSQSGHCMSATGKVGETRLIAVVMHSENSEKRFEDAIKLLDYGFSGYETVIPIKQDKVYAQADVINGSINRIGLAAAESFSLFGKKGKYNDIKTQYDISREIIYAPVKKGQILGMAKIYDGETLLGEVELYAAEDITKCKLGDYIKRVKKIVLF